LKKKGPSKTNTSFLGVVIVVEVSPTFSNIFHTFHSMMAKLELQGEKKKKPKQLGNFFKAIK
jgi:hypothetical protein